MMRFVDFAPAESGFAVSVAVQEAPLGMIPLLQFDVTLKSIQFVMSIPHPLWALPEVFVIVIVFGTEFEFTASVPKSQVTGVTVKAPGGGGGGVVGVGVGVEPPQPEVGSNFTPTFELVMPHSLTAKFVEFTN